MSIMSLKELEVAELIVETLNLEDVTPGDIVPGAPLFRDGLGLDSIDALELSLGIQKKYGIKLRDSDSNITQIFSSLSALANHISENSQ